MSGFEAGMAAVGRALRAVAAVTPRSRAEIAADLARTRTEISRLEGRSREYLERKLELVEAERDVHAHFRFCPMCRDYGRLHDRVCADGDVLGRRYRALAVGRRPKDDG